LSYRDGLAVQLTELRTIHPKKIPRPTQPIRDFFVFIVTPPSRLNKFTALTVLLSSEYVTLIVQRFCHPLSWKTLLGVRHGWFGPGFQGRRLRNRLTR